MKVRCANCLREEEIEEKEMVYIDLKTNERTSVKEDSVNTLEPYLCGFNCMSQYFGIVQAVRASHSKEVTK
jgi:hypothetical protein